MNILAFIIALFSAILSFLQGGCGTVLSGLGHGLSSEYGSRGDTELFAAIGAASFLIVLASFVGLTGGILAIQRKRSAFTVLLVSAGMCGLAFVMSGGNFAAGGVWGVLYLVSAICARFGYNNIENNFTVFFTPQLSINNINMRILAIIFAVIGILLNLFQKLFGRDSVSIADALYFTFQDISIVGRISFRNISEIFVVLISLTLLLAVIILPIIGCIRLIRKKRGKIFFTIPAITCSVIFLLIIIFNANKGPFDRIALSSGFILNLAIFYSLAAICAWLDERKKTLETQITQQNTDNQNIRPAVTLSKKEVTGSVPQKTYEPVIGIATDALIKRAMLFLEDGEIYNAERYLEQALNQDPENPQVYMAKLMLEHRVKSPVELLSKLLTPLEDEKLFQRALRFADGEYKSQLDGLAQASRDKLEQERLAKEAEIERIRAEKEAEIERRRAEKEAEKEKLYQEILNLKRTASTTFDFEQLLKLINSLRPYKDTDELYNEVNQVFQKEKYYQSATQNWREAKTSNEIQAVINRLEKLKGYKDVDELLSEAREKLTEAEKEEKRSRADKEAEKEKIYQEILNLKQTASSVSDFEQLIRLISSIRPYKNTNELYFEVVQAKSTEEEYQYTILHKHEAKKIDEIQAVINRLEKLKEYKDVDNLLNEAKKDLLEAEKKKRMTRIFIFLFLGIAIIITIGIWGYSEYTSRLAKEQEEARISQAAREEAQRREHQEQQNKQQRANEFFRLARELELIGAYTKARQYYRQAVELDHPEAQKYLMALEDKLAQQERQEEAQRQIYTSDYAKGEEYLNAKNYSPAFEIFKRLANDGYAPAQDKLAWMYQNGWGVKQDYYQAASWFRRAAEQENTEAMASMGLMYLRGWGVPQDYDLSLEWYSRAAAKGSEVAKRRVNSILLLKENKQKIALIERNGDYPVHGTIFAETLSIRPSPDTKSRAIKTLKTGHPVSVSRATEADNDYWLYITTASGMQGWVLAGYVSINENRELSNNERNNRRHSLPAQGYVDIYEDYLNIRDIPTLKGSKVVEKLNSGTPITVYDVFAGDTIDWYKVRTNYGIEGWVSGKYISIR